MAIRHLLYERELKVNDDISIVIPTVREVLEQEEEYYSLVSLITATPYDMMVQLDDLGIDFREISDYELFLLSFEAIKSADTHLVFGDLDTTGFERMVNTHNGTLALTNKKTGLVIDMAIHYQICEALRAIHHLKKNIKHAGNVEAKDYLLERARKKLKRRRKKAEASQLESLIIALVNTEQFPYKFDEVLDLTIYQFNESVLQVVKKIDFDNRMHGIYAGTISAKNMSQDSLNWMVH